MTGVSTAERFSIPVQGESQRFGMSPAAAHGKDCPGALREI